MPINRSYKMPSVQRKKLPFGLFIGWMYLKVEHAIIAFHVQFSGIANRKNVKIQTKPIKNTPQIKRLHYLAFDSKSEASGKVHNFPIFNHIFILSGIEISFDIFMSNLLASNVAFMRMISYLIESMKTNGVKQAFDLILRLWCYQKVANNREDHSMSIIIWCVNPAANTLYQLSIPKLVSWKIERRIQ